MADQGIVFPNELEVDFIHVGEHQEPVAALEAEQKGFRQQRLRQEQGSP